MRRFGRAFSLIEILVVAVLLMIVAAVVLPHYLGGKTVAGKTVRAPIVQAHDTECISNLRSVRQAIEAYRASDPDGGFPPSLQSLHELPSSVVECAVGHEPYRYDPQTGQVTCPHPGHESY